jgi:hypothetical protein
LAWAWPNKYTDLEIAIQRLSISLDAAIKHFLVHADEKGNRLVEDRFYKRLNEWNPERYEELTKRWDKWYDRHTELIHHATKAANWVADEVRSKLNPTYLEAKRFLVKEADGLQSVTKLLQYNPADKEEIVKNILWDLEHESNFIRIPPMDEP